MKFFFLFRGRNIIPFLDFHSAIEIYIGNDVVGLTISEKTRP